MTPEEIGRQVVAFLMGGAGVLGAHRIKRARSEARNDSEHPLGDLREILHAEGRLTKLETRFDDMVRRMDERDERAVAERLEILGAIEKYGQRLEGKVDSLRDTVYERRAAPRSE